MKAGISNIVTELILIAISVILVAVVYIWMGSILMHVESLMLPELPKLISAQISYASLRYSPAQTYDYGFYILVTFANFQKVTLKSVILYVDGEPLCTFTSFVPSADDVFLNGKALQFAGYYGEKMHQLDEYDSMTPGLILLSLSGKVGNSTANVGYASYENGYYTPVSPLGKEAPAWCSIYAGTYDDFLLTAYKVERYLKHSTAALAFTSLLNTKQKVFYNVTSLSWVSLRRYRYVTLGKGVYTLVMWCPSFKLGMGNVKIEIVTNMFTFKKPLTFS